MFSVQNERGRRANLFRDAKINEINRGNHANVNILAGRWPTNHNSKPAKIMRKELIRESESITLTISTYGNIELRAAAVTDKQPIPYST